MAQGDDTGVREVHVMFGNADSAGAVSREVVAARLAACANMLPGVRSIYWWDGAVQAGEEVLVIYKTVAGRVDQLVSFLKARHDYECPAIVVVPVIGGHAAYLDWVAAEAAGTETD